MLLSIEHATRYKFDSPVTYALQQIRKTPKDSHQQRVLNWTTEITGGRKELSYEDHHNNTTELISFDRNTTEVTVISRGSVQLTDTHGVGGSHRGPSPLWLYRRATARTTAKSGVRTLLRQSGVEPTLDGLHALSAGIRHTIAYEVDVSHAGWSAEDAIEAGRGVCQDHTHVMLACARALGLPARYVSGYLMLHDRTAQDAMHAWAEVHLDHIGWVGFDVSNGISPDTRYVRVATGLDYANAAPVSGTRIGGQGETLDVQISVAQQ